MSTRVVATEQAEAAAQQLRQIVSGSLISEIQKLRSIGQLLCNPSKWDSPRAQRFRTSDWPRMSRTMGIELEELGKLSTSVPKIIQDILTAGNECGGGQGQGQSAWDKIWEEGNDLGNRVKGGLNTWHGISSAASATGRFFAHLF